MKPLLSKTFKTLRTSCNVKLMISAEASVSISLKPASTAVRSVSSENSSMQARWCLRAFTSVYETNMDDTVQEPERKNCTFLFKRRKIHKNATRKRRGADGSDGEWLLININLNTRYLDIIFVSLG